MELQHLATWVGIPLVCKPHRSGINVNVHSSLIGYLLAYFSYLPVIWHHNQIRRKDPDKLAPESRLWWLLFREYCSTVMETLDANFIKVAPGLVIGLFGFAFTSFGPPTTPWIAPLIFTAVRQILC